MFDAFNQRPTQKAWQGLGRQGNAGNVRHAHESTDLMGGATADRMGTIYHSVRIIASAPSDKIDGVFASPTKEPMVTVRAAGGGAVARLFAGTQSPRAGIADYHAVTAAAAATFPAHVDGEEPELIRTVNMETMGGSAFVHDQPHGIRTGIKGVWDGASGVLPGGRFDEDYPKRMAVPALSAGGAAPFATLADEDAPPPKSRPDSPSKFNNYNQALSFAPDESQDQAYECARNAQAGRGQPLW